MVKIRTQLLSLYGMGGEDVNVLNMDKAEVEEALQELDRACTDILDDDLPALDKLFDNLDSDGVDK